MTPVRLTAALVLCLGALVVGAGPALAQDAEEARSVRIELDVGDFDGDEGDWPITVVHITGDLQTGQEFTVELLDDDGIVLWSGTDAFRAPTTSLTVAPFVAVGDVAGTAISQSLPEVAGEVLDRDRSEVLRQGAGGGGGGGTLALSMVLAVVLVAIVFRTPLPAATSQRWTK